MSSLVGTKISYSFFVFLLNGAFGLLAPYLTYKEAMFQQYLLYAGLGTEGYKSETPSSHLPDRNDLKQNFFFGVEGGFCLTATPLPFCIFSLSWSALSDGVRGFLSLHSTSPRSVPSQQVPIT